ncbi:MAG: hypothetical protein RBG1_1C00001G1402 [candidate division Zixibacteria bacterium RBG-1]|nr:MAG: hypothetical protein RBG1_1C00001G1402 [candidate division Zixibacteria bacterium RBG-1]
MIYRARKTPVGLLVMLALLIVIGVILVTFSKATGFSSMEATRMFGF